VHSRSGRSRETPSSPSKTFPVAGSLEGGDDKGLELVQIVIFGLLGGRRPEDAGRPEERFLIPLGKHLPDHVEDELVSVRSFADRHLGKLPQEASSPGVGAFGSRVILEGTPDFQSRSLAVLKRYRVPLRERTEGHDPDFRILVCEERRTVCGKILPGPIRHLWIGLREPALPQNRQPLRARSPRKQVEDHPRGVVERKRSLVEPPRAAAPGPDPSR